MNKKLNQYITVEKDGGYEWKKVNGGGSSVGGDSPSTQKQADWNQTDQTAVDFIKNKPEIPDAEVFVVTFTETMVEQEEGGEIIFDIVITADKTISQIVTAQNNGLLVIGQFIPAQVGAEGHQTYLLNYCNLYAQEGEVAEFYRIYQNSIHYINYVKQTTPTQEGGEVVNTIINVRNTPLAALNSPNFTGTPKAPTAPVGTNTTQLATTAFVKQAVDNIPTSGDENVIEGIKLNGTLLQPDADKVVSINNVPEVFVIHVTAGQTSGTYVSDITSIENEVWTAYNAGKIILCEIEGVHITLSKLAGSYVEFIHFTGLGAASIGIRKITARDNNVVEVQTVNATPLNSYTALVERVAALEAAQVNYTFNRTDNSLEINSENSSNNG